MNPKGLEQAAEEQLDTILPPFIDIEQVRKKKKKTFEYIRHSLLLNQPSSIGLEVQ